MQRGWQNGGMIISYRLFLVFCFFLNCFVFAGEHLVPNTPPNKDIQIVSGSLSKTLHLGEQVDFKKCSEIAVKTFKGGRLVNADCTNYFAEMLGVPLAHRLVIPYTESNGSISSDWRCYDSQIVAAIKTKALESSSFVRVGFYHSHGELLLTPKKALHTLGKATLKSGDEVTLTQFTSLAQCWLGTASSSAYQTQEFKPFVDFGVEEEGGSLSIYRRWEDVPTNFKLGWGKEFDRSTELFQSQPY